jgi:hypothetical protein
MTTHRRSIAPTIELLRSSNDRLGHASECEEDAADKQTSLREIQLPQSAAGLTRDIPLGPYTQGLKLLYAGDFNNGHGSLHRRRDRRRASAIDHSVMERRELELVSGSAINPSGAKYGAADSRSGSTTAVSSTFRRRRPDCSRSIRPSSRRNGSVEGLQLSRLRRFEIHLSNATEIGKVTFSRRGLPRLYDGRTATRGYTMNCPLVIREVMTNTRWGMKANATTFIDDTFGTRRPTMRCRQLPERRPRRRRRLRTPAPATCRSERRATSTRASTQAASRHQSVPASILVSGTTAKINVTIPTGDSLTTKYNVYRSGINQLTNYHKVGELAGNTGGTFQDNVSAVTWATGATPATSWPVTNKRFQIGMLISQQTSALDWLETLRAHCLGVFTQDGGKYQLQINKALPGGYVRQKYSEAHNWGGNNEAPNVIARSIRWGRKRRRELFNEIEVQFTDYNNDFAPGSIVKQRAAVAAGTEVARRAVYRLPGILDSAQAGVIATLLLNLEWDDAWFEWEADRTALKTIPWDVVALSGNGLSNQDVRVRAVRPTKRGTFMLRGFEYHDASNSATIQGSDSPISTGNVGVAGGGVPADVLGFFAVPNGLHVMLTWQRTNDPDVQYYEIRRGATTDTWSTATFVGQSQTLTYQDTLPYFAAQRYFVKA